MTEIGTYARVYALEQQLRAIRDPNRDPAEFEAVQARADSVAALHGDKAPPPILGESLLNYRKRLLAQFQGFSPQFEKTRLHSFDAPTIEALEQRIYADAQAAAYQSTQPGELRAVVSRDDVGRKITKFVGDVSEFLAPFMDHGQRVRINSRP
jgi:hypothetical protein